jgi:hypothetical protein
VSTAALGAQWTDHIPHDVDSWLSEGPHGQQALFPHTGKGPTRPLEHAEMTPDQFRTLPGAWHHGTYHHEMPTNANKLGSATSGGIHFGTHQAAVERIHGLGYRNESYRDAAARPGARIKPLNDAAPAEIHVRRIALGTQFANTPDTPGHDADDSWSHPENQPHANLYYRNAHEDKGALSIKRSSTQCLPAAGCIRSVQRC